LEHFEGKKERILYGFAYLADICNHMNEINILIQGSEDTIMYATEKLQVSLAKLSIWEKKIKLHGLSPRANYTDRATAACRQSDCQLLRIEGATWSA
jgi:hypothetical protein